MPIFRGTFNRNVDVGEENYSSALIKSNWEYVYEYIEGEESFIIKFIPDNIVFDSLLPGFIREKNFYEKFWPKCEKHLFLSQQDLSLFDPNPVLNIPK